jgi:ribosomal protein L32
MCLDCGFYKGRMVMDMSAKKKARDERLQAKKDAIKAQSGEESDEVVQENTVPTDEVSTEKTEVLEAPEMAKEKGAKPRKGQAS